MNDIAPLDIAQVYRHAAGRFLAHDRQAIARQARNVDDATVRSTKLPEIAGGLGAAPAELAAGERERDPEGRGDQGEPRSHEPVCEAPQVSVHLRYGSTAGVEDG